MALLEVKNIHVYYGNIHALKDLSLNVDKGEIVTLIGANGAGKSTTLKTLSGLLKPRSGSVQLEGDELTRYPAHQIVTRGMIHVPEGRRIFGRLTVQENLEMGAFTVRDEHLNKINLTKVFDLFPRLKERRSQLGGTLSGGEQQMLAMGRALMSNPKVLFLDEPSMGLAPVLVDSIFENIRQMHSAGMTILLVEQNARIALQVASRGYVLQTGSIALADTAANLQSNEMVRKVYMGEA
jgi:branched-chain amino acid transport system ATP-binding protein